MEISMEIAEEEKWDYHTIQLRHSWGYNTEEYTSHTVERPAPHVCWSIVHSNQEIHIVIQHKNG